MNALTGAIIVAIAAILWHLPRRAPPQTGAASANDPGGRTGSANGLYRAGVSVDRAGVPAAALAAAPPTAAEPARPVIDVPRAMREWRLAIENRNAEAVEALDRAFAEHPTEFVPALMASAETDPEERVRAFCTRVLGKLRSAESQGLMRRLLGDPSELVRFNAAWAVGQLHDHEATPKLRSLQKHDRSKMVRQAASETLDRMNGG
jgi:hypothetical protein